MTAYDNRYCEQLKVHCENGKSLESFCAVLRVSPKVMTEWFLEYPEFQEAVEMAPCIELLYWEMTMVRAMQHKDKESMNIAKSKIDYLSKLVTSPIKKNTFNDLKEVNVQKQSSSSGDLVKDLYLLADRRK